jgi:hypothetical protein
MNKILVIVSMNEESQVFPSAAIDSSSKMEEHE